MTEQIGSHPFRCLMCDIETVVRLERSDGTVRWACTDHYETVVEDFRRWPGDPIFVDSQGTTT